MQRRDGEVWWRDGLMKRCVSVIERCDWHCGLTTTTLHLLLRESANNAWLWQVTTVDRYQGQQNDYILLSLVRTRTVGHLRSVTSVSFFLCYTVSHNKCCNAVIALMSSVVSCSWLALQCLRMSCSLLTWSAVVGWLGLNMSLWLSLKVAACCSCVCAGVLLVSMVTIWSRWSFVCTVLWLCSLNKG